MPAGTKMPEDLSEMKRYAKTMFDYAAKIALKENFQKIVIFLDALNQMDDDGNKLYLLAFKVRSHNNIFGPIYPFNSLSTKIVSC